MKMTNHAATRCQQRGISSYQVDIILQHGKKSRKPGGVYEVRLRGKDKNKIILDLKRQINKVEKCAGKAVLINSDQDTVITTYHLTE